MPYSVTDLRSKFVMQQLADLYSEPNYIHNLVTQLGEPLQRGEAIEVPSLDEFTVASDGTTGKSADTISASPLHLVANREPFVNVELTLPERMQGLEGQLGAAVIRQAVDAMSFSMDRDLVDYMLGLAWDASGTYRVNAGAATASLAHIAEAKGRLLSNRGEHRLAMFVHPLGEARYTSIVEFHPDSTMQSGSIGVPFLGMAQGIPVYTSNAVPYRRQVATSAWAITGTDTVTLTVAAGHNVVPGTLVTHDAASAGGDIETPLAVESVSATEIVLTGSGLVNGSATEAGTLELQCAENMVVDTAHLFAAMQLMPTPREVPIPGNSKSELQLSSLWGFIGRPGRVIVVETAV